VEHTAGAQQASRERQRPECSDGGHIPGISENPWDVWRTWRTVDPRRMARGAIQGFALAAGTACRRQSDDGPRDEGRKNIVEPDRRLHRDRLRRILRSISATLFVTGTRSRLMSRRPSGVGRVVSIAARPLIQVVAATRPRHRSRRETRGAHHKRGEQPFIARAETEHGKRRRGEREITCPRLPTDDDRKPLEGERFHYKTPRGASSITKSSSGPPVRTSCYG
jgi:hypothetical protein